MMVVKYKLEEKAIDFYYSIGSRYSYLAATQIGSLAAEFDVQIIWHPINSVRLISQRGSSPFKNKPISGQYEWDYRQLDAQRWAEFYNVSFSEPRGKVNFSSELLALACTTAKYFDRAKQYSLLMFKAIFEESLSQIDDDECIRRAEACGINADDFQNLLRSEEISNRLNGTIDSALDFGVFGVPTFAVSGELFWGNDRIILLRHYLQTKNG